MVDKTLAVLNTKWRVIQRPYRAPIGIHFPVWILERYEFCSWKYTVACRKRNTLLRNIKEKCGDVDNEALKIIKNLPVYLEDMYHPLNHNPRSKRK